MRATRAAFDRIDARAATTASGADSGADADAGGS